MVDRILFYPWCAYEVMYPMGVVSKAGWAPLPGGYQRLMKEFPESESVAVDKSLWDWTMPGWVVRGFVDVKLAQCGNRDAAYERIVWSRLRQVLGPRTRFRMRDGVEWIQSDWGLMKSGWFCTLSMNGMAQGLQHALAWYRMGNRTLPPLIWTMGDDTLTRMKMDDAELDNYRKCLETCGCIVKKVERSREFAGFSVFGDDIASARVEPLYPDKHQFILRYVESAVERDTMLSFSLLYALSNQQWFNAIADRCTIAIGPAQRLWAKGLVKLDILQVLPTWTDY